MGWAAPFRGVKEHALAAWLQWIVYVEPESGSRSWSEAFVWAAVDFECMSQAEAEAQSSIGVLP